MHCTVAPSRLPAVLQEQYDTLRTIGKAKKLLRRTQHALRSLEDPYQLPGGWAERFRRENPPVASHFTDEGTRFQVCHLPCLNGTREAQGAQCWGHGKACLSGSMQSRRTCVC